MKEKCRKCGETYDHQTAHVCATSEPPVAGSAIGSLRAGASPSDSLISSVVRSEKAVRRVCVVCGAKVRNQNPKTKTCDSVCTAARANVKTRPEQLKWEMEHPREDDHEYCRGCGMISSQCQCWDAINQIN